jgi:hypothetical protein
MKKILRLAVVALTTAAAVVGSTSAAGAGSVNWG